MLRAPFPAPFLSTRGCEPSGAAVPLLPGASSGVTKSSGSLSERFAFISPPQDFAVPRVIPLTVLRALVGRVCALGELRMLPASCPRPALSEVQHHKVPFVPAPVPANDICSSGES